MKLLSLVSIFFLLTSCKREIPWYSNIDKKQIIKDDREFFLNKANYNPKFFIVLENFKKSLIQMNTNKLYDYRTKEFRQIVSKSIYKNEILGKTDTPNEVYFSNKNTIIGNKDATVKVFYVYKNKDFSYCVESKDIWVIGNDGNWNFVSNSTPWGTSITEK